MEFREQLSRIAGRLKIDTDDPRHTVLDISDDFAAVASDRNDFPPALREEVGQILEELEQIQPQFKSHRKTSIFFDREGLGRPGKKRAGDLALRIIAVHRAIANMPPGESP